MKIFVFLVILAATAANATLDCPVSNRFPWMISPLSLGSPWSDYTSPNNQCCDVVNPETSIDFNVSCYNCLSDDNTKSSPGFMLDPNNCQKFYMCVPNGDGFDAHSMICPDCMFWDDNKLSCIEVDDSCRVSVSVETGAPNPLFTHDPIVSCIDFENIEDLSTKGMYVFNNGVTVVENGVGGIAEGFCPEGNNCGYFNASQLEIPFFSNNYNHLPNLKITFQMYSTSIEEIQGVISNDCDGQLPNTFGNSLAFGKSTLDAIAIITAADGNYSIAQFPMSVNEWINVTVEFDRTNLTLTINDVSQSVYLPTTFNGIRESHCPLVIGSLIKQSSQYYFQGFIDNVCFTIDYEK